MSKVILITGASSGIGFTTAKRLIQDGYTVYCCARRVELMKGLKTLGGRICELDVTDEKMIYQVVGKIIKEVGKIDVLINNAGYGLYGAVEDISLDQARKQFEVNVFGLATVTKAVLQQMRSVRSGRIINISSMGGKVYTPLGAWYHATKHAIEGWSDCLRLELKEFNIDVVIVEPGVIKTSFGDVAGEPMLKNSGKGPYRKLAIAMARSLENSYRENGEATDPDIVADKISRIVASRSIRTRYIVGYLAKPLMWVRKYLGDKVYDMLIMSQIK